MTTSHLASPLTAAFSIATNITEVKYVWLYELAGLETFELRLHSCTPGQKAKYEWVVITNILSFFIPGASALRHLDLEVTENPLWFTHLVDEPADMKETLEDLFETPPKLESVSFSSTRYQKYKLHEDTKELTLLTRALPRLCASGKVRVGNGRDELNIRALKADCVETERALADVGAN